MNYCVFVSGLNSRVIIIIFRFFFSDLLPTDAASYAVKQNKTKELLFF